MTGKYIKRYGLRKNEGFICEDCFVYMEYVTAWQPLPEAYKPETQKEILNNYYAERFNKVV